MIKKYTPLVLLFIGILLFDVAMAQDKLLEKADENFNRFAFVDARKIYQKVAESGYSSADLFKKLGDSYYFNAELDQAVVWYEKLVTNYADEIEPEYMFRYSQSLKNVKRYEEADKIMEKFNAMSENDQRAEYFMNTRDYLNFIEMQSGKFRLLKLTTNSKFSDYAPSFNNQGQLIFASSRKGNTGISKTVHEWNEMPFLDLFSSDIIEENGIIKTPKKLKGKINSKFHESSTSFSKDGQTVYFTRNNYTKRRLGKSSKGNILLKIYRATLNDDGVWTTIEELAFNDNEYSVAHPALSADGKKLYFASDMPGSKGLSDLYVVDVNEDGTFGEPKNLGDHINTEGRETFPYISDSGRLYFASDGHIGLGGLDVFVSVPEEDGFSIPYNVGKPVNGSTDDFTFVLNEDTKIGYFASNRSGGKGNDDIYSFKQTEELITNCNQYVSGVVTDSNTKEILPEAEVILLDDNNKELQKVVTNEKGEYKFDLECDTQYIVRASKSEYAPTEVLLPTNKTLEFEHELALQISKGGIEDKEINEGDDLAKLLALNIIYFDLNKFDIRPDAEIELQKIIATLQEYPQLKIDVRSHTDSRAGDNYNMYLSEQRAKSTIKYITEKGSIDTSRVTGRGYGETALVNKCSNGIDCSDQEHQSNRRSEFIVIE